MFWAVQRFSPIFTYVFPDVQRCSHMFKDGQWPLVIDVHRWSLMLTIVHRYSQMFTDVHRCSKMVTDVPGVQRCSKMSTDLHRWSLMFMISLHQCPGGLMSTDLHICAKMVIDITSICRWAPPPGSSTSSPWQTCPRTRRNSSNIDYTLRFATS